MLRKRVLLVGAVYITGIFLVYLGIGLGLLKAIHLLGEPHLIAKVAGIMVLFLGFITLREYLYPEKSILHTREPKTQDPLPAYQGHSSVLFRSGNPRGALHFPLHRRDLYSYPGASNPQNHIFPRITLSDCVQHNVRDASYFHPCIGP